MVIGIIKKYSDKHAWNMAKVDDEFYHVDVTWDDTKNRKWGLPYFYFLIPGSLFEERCQVTSPPPPPSSTSQALTTSLHDLLWNLGPFNPSSTPLYSLQILVWKKREWNLT